MQCRDNTIHNTHSGTVANTGSGKYNINVLNPTKL